METSPTRQTARHHSRLSAKHRSLAVLSPLPALSSRDQSRCYISLDAKPPTYKHTLAEIRYPERDKTAGNRKLKLEEKTLDAFHSDLAFTGCRKLSFGESQLERGAPADLHRQTA